MRALPEGLETLAPVTQNDTLQTLTRQFTLLTPMAGGGAIAGESDLTCPINGKSVRGQLRFWWRATQAPRFQGLKEMRDTENGIWGSTEEPSRTDVVVDIKEESIKSFRYHHKDETVPQYVGFPFQKQSGEQKSPAKALLKAGLEFSVTITTPATCLEEVKAALWAWECFGGIGARTRRGLGAFTSPEMRTNPKEYIKQHWGTYVKNGTPPEGVPYLKDKPSCSASSWGELIKKYKDFRQSRHPGCNKPGRSHWPEPDVIRKLTGCSHPKYSRPIHNPRINKFPRAVFGLPIVFQLRNPDKRPKDAKDKDREPERTTLEGEEHDRYSSPLILKPLSKSLCIALLLKVEGSIKPLKTLRLKESSHNQQHEVRHDLEKKEAKEIIPLNGNTDVIAAFLEKL